MSLMNAKSASREALINAIEAGEMIPDHLLPIGIHRTSPNRWRAHLMTGGKKFSGPPRDSVKEAVEDKRRLCSETGVEFVMYGKQSHAKPEQRPANWLAAVEQIDFGAPVLKETRKAPVGGEAAQLGYLTGLYAGIHHGLALGNTQSATPQAPPEAVKPKQASKPAPKFEVPMFPENMAKVFKDNMQMNTEMNKHPWVLLETFTETTNKTKHIFDMFKGGDKKMFGEQQCVLFPIEIEDLVIDSVSINDEFVWRLNPSDDVFNDPNLQTYVSVILIDHGLVPSLQRINAVLREIDSLIYQNRVGAVLTRKQFLNSYEAFLKKKQSPSKTGSRPKRACAVESAKAVSTGEEPEEKQEEDPSVVLLELRGGTSDDLVSVQSGGIQSESVQSNMEMMTYDQSELEEQGVKSRIVESIVWNAFTPDLLNEEFARNFVFEHSIPNTSGVLYQIVKATVEQRCHLYHTFCETD